MTIEFRLLGADGREHWLRGQSRPRQRGGETLWEGILLDVTDTIEERARADAALRESDERLRQVFVAASIGIAVLSPDGIIQQGNPAFRAIADWPENDRLEGHDFFSLVARSSLPLGDDAHADLDTFCIHATPQLPSGAKRQWRITGSRFSAPSQSPAPLLLMLIEDVTELSQALRLRRQMELALQEAQKLEALGRLAGGIAHELNNMLGPILMAAEMVRRHPEPGPALIERCDRIIEAAKHGRDIVRNVLAYCRKERKALSTLDLVAQMRQFVALATSILPPGVRLELASALERAPILGDPGQIQQIMLNLANNARDAMDGQGLLRLEILPVQGRPAPTILPAPAGGRKTAAGAADAIPYDRFASLAPERAHVELRVADTGHGMDGATASRIFDPFFTTKPVGQGTGLGLSVVQGIVADMGGVIAVESAPGWGTVVRLVLPLLDTEPSR